MTGGLAEKLDSAGGVGAVVEAGMTAAVGTTEDVVTNVWDAVVEDTDGAVGVGNDDTTMVDTWGTIAPVDFAMFCSLVEFDLCVDLELLFGTETLECDLSRRGCGVTWWIACGAMLAISKNSTQHFY